MTRCTEREPALNALFDGELDGLNTSEVEAHVRTCAACRAYLAMLSDVRDVMASATLEESAPDSLRKKVESLVGAPEPHRVVQGRPRAGGYLPWVGGGAIGALAASLALVIGAPPFGQADMPDQVIAGHIRSLQASHLTDVLTSDRHVVKPWFNGRLDFSPPVVDLAQQGFPLVGGRLDYIEGRPIAALVYRRRLHTINLFIRPASGGGSIFPATLHRQTYTLIRWKAGDLEYWAVSDIDGADLSAFRTFFDKAAAN